jgi:hypothetical protein
VPRPQYFSGAQVFPPPLHPSPVVAVPALFIAVKRGHFCAGFHLTEIYVDCSQVVALFFCHGMLLAAQCES